MIKRDDLIHPILSGNKLRKIKGFINQFLQGEYEGIISTGGLNSNHLHALGFVCHKLSIPFVCQYYGSDHFQESYVINDLNRWGAQCVQIPRNSIGPQLDIDSKNEENWMYVPEGGAGPLAAEGIADLFNEIPDSFDQSENAFALACGTGTTMAHLAQYLKNAGIMWMSPVKNFRPEISYGIDVIKLGELWSLPFAGYSIDLIHYIDQFYRVNGIWLDPVYTSRLCIALDLYLNNSNFLGEILVLHSGGLQSWRKFLKRYPEAVKHLDIQSLEPELKKIEHLAAQ